MDSKTFVEIEDIRIQNDFTKCTFSKFKKIDAKKQLLKSILNGKLEESNYWTAEFICAGLFLDLWEIIFFVCGKHIHLGNPKLPVYIGRSMNIFKTILVKKKYVSNEIGMRNEFEIRKLFCEIISILVFSRKKNSFDIVKIQKNDFDLGEISFKLKASHLKYVDVIFSKDDPKELFIACNELAYCISYDVQKSQNAIYWIEWILEFEKICKKKKERCICKKRSNYIHNEKMQTNIIWLIWDILIHETKNRESELLTTIIQSILDMYTLHFSVGIVRKRRYLLYFVVSLLTDVFNSAIKLYDSSEHNIDTIVRNMNKIYYEIKKNEIHGETSYLFYGLQEKSNKEKTLEKLNIVNSVDSITTIK